MKKELNLFAYGFGILISVIVGLLIGYTFDRIGLGIALSLPFGVGIGFLLSDLKK
ncbi:MAG: hypothetical protein HKN33_10450 [Pyrinomonadaceae bacterium]|nr:hypothetical protein [Pyrinomonadaceae bacterium]